MICEKRTSKKIHRHLKQISTLGLVTSLMIPQSFMLGVAQAAPTGRVANVIEVGSRWAKSLLPSVLRRNKGVVDEGAATTIRTGMVQKEDLIARNSRGVLSDIAIRNQNDPLMTPVLGREKDILLFQTKLATNNVVALTGPRGAGKSQIVAGFVDLVSQGKVPRGLQKTRAFSVQTTNNNFESSNAVETLIESQLLAHLDSETRVVLLHFTNIPPNLLSKEHPSQLDMIYEAVDRIFREHNAKHAKDLGGDTVQFKIVLEGDLGQINSLRETNPILFGRMAQQAIEPLTSRIVSQATRAFAQKLVETENTKISATVQDRAIQLAETYYSDHGTLDGVKKLLVSALNQRRALIANHTLDMPITKLEEGKARLIKELADARELVAALDQAKKKNGVRARELVDELPNRIRETEAAITKVTGNLQALKALAADKDVLDAQLRQMAITGQKKLSEDLLVKKEKILAELNVISVEDLALFIHLDKGVEIEELLVAFKPASLEEKFRKYKELIFGQDRAVKTIFELSKQARDEDEAVPTVMLLGMPGTGKTELSRTHALVEKGSYSKLIKIDGADLAQDHATTVLTGAPPSYAGYGDGSDLIARVANMPDATILIDEFGRMSRQIANNNFLSIMSSGKGKNTSNVSADFSRTFIILTTNDGKHLPPDTPKEKIVEYFRSIGYDDALLDRISEFVIMNPLGNELWGFVFQKNLKKLNQTRLANTLNYVEVTGPAETGILARIEVGSEGSVREVERAFKKFRQKVDELVQYGFYTNDAGQTVKMAVAPGDKIIADWSEADGLVFRIAQMGE